MTTTTKTHSSDTLKSLSYQAFQECECIESLRESTENLKSAKYFLDLASQYFNPEWIRKQQPKVIVLGTSFPAEIVYAYTGESPFRVFGGSRAMTDVSDSDVPRDTDPVSRSMLGYLQAAKHMAKDALVIVPFISDSQRKLAFILKDQGWNVETVHLPPQPVIGGAVVEDEMRRLCSVLSLHCKKWRPAYKKAAAIMEKTERAIRRFTLLSSKRSDVISGALRMLALDSFYMTQDLSGWVTQLEKLSEELSGYDESLKSDSPKVLIVGSPIHFSNYKIPFLLEEIGMDYYSAAFPLDYDSSGAHIRNDSLCSAIREQVELIKPDGIIWHILRGQNEYDFELFRLEEHITEKLKLPVFRLETDYQVQDVEQLRIRMEAFAELLSGRAR